ncbi:MAG: GTPase HflX [Alphaproteobacteria bacterium]|nr:GTPase HflX [Alphaproteobacteria bacterium]
MLLPYERTQHAPEESEAARIALRPAEARLAEAVGLTESIGLGVVHAAVLPLRAKRPATLIGKGQLEAAAATVREHEIGVVVVDATLTPVQQRNLEKGLGCKVIDRTALILEIFGERARTREGILQVELAHLDYQRSRLVRSWTHLERQRGGFGFLGGPGETQIEADRRLIGERIVKIKRELAEVRRTRGLHRAARKRVPYPVVALVGYTNAGKSTLFNTLTGAGVLAKDQLFATLDPAMRALKLPSGRNAILSDTVGFISSLPHELVAAFRATLEEVAAADIILHVRDIAHPDSAAQKADVEAVLADMASGRDASLDADWRGRVIEVWNKADLLTPEEHGIIAARSDRPGEVPQMLISALSGEGLPALLAAIDARLSAQAVLREVTLDPADGAGLAWLYRHGEVVARQDAEDAIRLSVRLSPENAERFERRHKAAADPSG